MKIRRFSPAFYIIFFLAFSSLALVFWRASTEEIQVQEGFMNLGLPILSVQTDGLKAVKTRENYRKAKYNFTYNGKTLKGSCKIRGRGNSTWTTFDTNKRSYLLKVEKEIAPFGMAQARKWVLQANVTDKTSLRNIYAYYLGNQVFNKCGWAPKTQFIVFILNGKILGLYGFMEKAEIGPGRVELDQDDSFLGEVNERSSKRHNRIWNFTSHQGIDISLREKEGKDTDYYQRAEDRIKAFEDILYSDNFTDPEKGWKAYADPESFADWYLLNEYSRNPDGRMRNSCYFRWKENENKFYMGPFWDYDISFGNNNDPMYTPTQGFYIQTERWYKRMFEDPDFREIVRSRWLANREKLEESLVWLQEMANNIEEAANLDDKIWQRFGYRQWPNAPGYKSRRSYKAEFDYLYNWCRQRLDWMNSPQAFG